MITFLFALFLSPFSHAETRLETACMKQMSSEPSRKEICHCLQANLQKKAKPAEISLLADVYEGKAVAATKLQKQEFSALAEMDARVAENCAANPEWKMAGDTKPAKKKK